MVLLVALVVEEEDLLVLRVQAIHHQQVHLKEAMVVLVLLHSKLAVEVEVLVELEVMEQQVQAAQEEMAQHHQFQDRQQPMLVVVVAQLVTFLQQHQKQEEQEEQAAVVLEDLQELVEHLELPKQVAVAVAMVHHHLKLLVLVALVLSSSNTV